MTLYDLTTLDCNNSDCVVLKVNEGAEMELIRLGCFNGDETMFRITKGMNMTYTVFKKDGKHYSWEPGTLVSDAMSKRARMIQECVIRYYGISLR